MRCFCSISTHWRSLCNWYYLQCAIFADSISTGDFWGWYFKRYMYVQKRWIYVNDFGGEEKQGSRKKYCWYRFLSLNIFFRPVCTVDFPHIQSTLTICTSLFCVLKVHFSSVILLLRNSLIILNSRRIINLENWFLMCFHSNSFD